METVEDGPLGVGAIPRPSAIRGGLAVTSDDHPAEDLAPTIPAGTTPQQCIAMWLDLLDACDQFLLAGLRRQIGPDGDLQAAYRGWYAEYLEEHDRMMFHMAAEFARRATRMEWVAEGGPRESL